MLNIRNINSDDIETLIEVQKKCFIETYSSIMDSEFIIGLTHDRLFRYWSNILNINHVALKLVLSQETIGYSVGGAVRRNFNGCDSEIYSIYVLRRYQKKGFGLLLFDRMLKNLYDLGFQFTVLYVLDSNPSVGFYKRMAGKFEGLIKSKYGNKYYDERIYSWDLRKFNKRAVI